MKGKHIFGAVALTLASMAPALAQEQYIPQLVYRTGAYASNGIPWSHGKIDYMNYINAKGGINGVKITFDECETSYATDKGVECYERLKTSTTAVIDPQGTGITTALTEKAPVDKIPLITVLYGLAASQDGRVFKWNFPLMGNYWMMANIQVQHLAKKEGGFDKLKGKKIAVVYFDAAAGKEPIPAMERLARQHGFNLTLLPVTVPGLEQKATWLQVRQLRPDYVLLWGYGVMNPTTFKEAAAVGFAREKMLGWWWSGAEPDIKEVGVLAKGYQALAANPVGTNYPLMQDMLKTLYDDAKMGAGAREDVGSVLYTRGVLMSLLTVEAIRRAQEQYGIGQVMTGEQVRWGFENLNLDAERLRALGLAEEVRPIRTTCFDHMGSAWARVQTWDGQRWVMGEDWYEADKDFVGALVKEAADRYAAERGITRRDAADCRP